MATAWKAIFTGIALISAFALTFAAESLCPVRCVSCINGVAECSKRSLVTPPKDFPLTTHMIILDNNHLRVLGTDSFQKLEQVEVLRLKGNKLRSIKGSAFKLLPRLMTVDLSDNDLTTVDGKGFEGLTNLQTLSLQYNKLKTLSRVLDSTPMLYQLNVAYNNLREIGKNDLKTPTKIHYLDLRNNRIQKIHPQAFAHLTLLRYLFLNKNPLVTVPDMTFASQVLQLVDFSSCRLTHVPKTMPDSVTDFRLNDNKIMQINDTDFANMTKLKMLALNNNQLHFVANTALSHLVHLEEVWLRNNRLVYIPRGLPDNLRTLYMDSNQIREIEDGLFTNQSKLHYLTVEMNKISHVGNKTFAGLRFLKSLNFRGNKLRVIEAGTFTSLHNLSTLSLSDNPLERIERGAFLDLGNLTFLHLVMCGEEMALEENFLEHMPNLQQLSLMNSPGLAEAFIKMVHDNPLIPLKLLSEIDLTYNDLQTLTPNVLETFPALTALYLDGNPWACDKRLAWLKDWMLSSDVSFSKHESVLCEKPFALKGRDIRNVDVNQFGEVVPASQTVSQEEYDKMMAKKKAEGSSKSHGKAFSGKDHGKDVVIVAQNDATVAPTSKQLITDKTTFVLPNTLPQRKSRKERENGKKEGKNKDKQNEQKGKEKKHKKDNKKKKMNGKNKVKQPKSSEGMISKHENDGGSSLSNINTKPSTSKTHADPNSG